MKSDFLRIIFDIIVLIVLAVLIYIIIMAIIGVSIGKNLEYIGYLNTIVKDINNGGNGEVFINNYDYNYVFVLTKSNGWHLQLYHCLPPSSNVGLLSTKTVYWNVSTTDSGNIIVFAPALAFCELVKQKLLEKVDQINITIQGLNDNAGLLALVLNSNNVGLNSNLIINIPLTNDFFPSGTIPSLAILNDTTITCKNSGGCTYKSSLTGESSIYCAPNPNINPSNNNLPYNPSDCVELSGFPLNPQLTLSNFVSEVASSEMFSPLQIFQTSFPLLYFAGSLPPTSMYIYVSSNKETKTANINIYIGETVPTST
jgi:hypothetical protein